MKCENCGKSFKRNKPYYFIELNGCCNRCIDLGSNRAATNWLLKGAGYQEKKDNKASLAWRGVFKKLKKMK